MLSGNNPDSTKVNNSPFDISKEQKSKAYGFIPTNVTYDRYWFKQRFVMNYLPVCVLTYAQRSALKVLNGYSIIYGIYCIPEDKIYVGLKPKVLKCRSRFKPH